MKTIENLTTEDTQQNSWEVVRTNEELRANVTGRLGRLAGIVSVELEGFDDFDDDFALAA
jgi:hypothetical protein